MDFK
jgi:hypothetical protein